MDWNWLTQNLIVPTVLAAGTWLWHKLHAEKKADQKSEQRTEWTIFERTIRGAIDSILSEIVDHVPSNAPVETWLKGARDYVEKRIWAALGKRGIPRNAMTEALVHMALEESTARLGARIAAERAARKEG